MVVRSHRSFRLPESKRHYPPRMDFRTHHVKIDVSLDFERKRIFGACTLEIDPIRPGLERVSLDAGEMDITRCLVDGDPAEFEYDNSVLVVSMKPREGRRSVTVEYGATPQEGLYFTAPDAEHPEREVQAWTHSEPESARFWFPCHDHPADRATSETIVRVPREFRVISNGRLLSTRQDGETTEFHWREDVPHSSYLTSFVAGKFGEIVQEVDGIKLRYNFPESKRQDVMRYFGETPRVIEVLEELTGVRYPYEKYDQTTVEGFIAGGEENINATTLAMNYYPEEGSEEDFSPTYAAPWANAVSLVAHEAAHQWFGDLVTCSDWCHAWINEGFATYLQSLYVERTRGTDQMRWEMRARESEYFEEDETQYRRPIVDREYVWPHDLFDHTLYRKGAAMIHELRFIMGDDTFFRGIRGFLTTYSKACADTHDFRKEMERASGLPLEEFFDQAFFKPGYPEFEVGYAWVEDAKSATLRISQVQDTTDGTPVFKLPCDVVFYVEGKRRRFRTMLESAEQTLTFSFESKPTIVEFDPERWILKKVKFDKTIELLINQLEHSQDAYSRAEAATALGRTASSRAILALEAAAKKEQFWDVQACALRALGELGSSQALDALARVGLPSNRRSRRGLAKALGAFKGEKAREMLVNLLETDQSPYVRCEAALALAKAWPDGALPHLKKSLTVQSPNEALAEACVEAMGRLKGEEANRVISECLPYGKPTRVRIGALKAIKTRGRITDDELPGLKEILKRDKEFRVRQYMVSALLKELADGRFTDILEEVARKDRNGGIRRSALEAFYEISGGVEKSTALTKLRAEVEELKEENRKLARTEA